MKKKLGFAMLVLLVYVCSTSAAFADSSDGVAHVWGLIEEADLAMPFFAVAICVPFALGLSIVFLKKWKRLEPADQF